MNLNMDALEMVSGGTGEASGNKTRFFFAEYDGHTYEMWKSDDSGDETYIIDGQVVQPSKFYKEYYGVGR